VNDELLRLPVRIEKTEDFARNLFIFTGQLEAGNRLIQRQMRVSREMYDDATLDVHLYVEERLRMEILDMLEAVEEYDRACEEVGNTWGR